MCQFSSDTVCLSPVRIPNALANLIPEAADFGSAVHVALQRDAESALGGAMTLHVDALAQRGVLHLADVELGAARDGR